MGKIPTEKFIYGTHVETWKRLILPATYKTDQILEISNYGRVRKIIGFDNFHIKKGSYYDGRIIYRFIFPPSLNDGVRLQYHIDAKTLVAIHFCKGYEKGKYVVWKDYNKLNNSYKNLLVCNQFSGRSHAAKGVRKNAEQVLVLPPLNNSRKVKVAKEPHKVTSDDNFFKPIPGYSKYEICRNGVVRILRGINRGKILKQRHHPDKFYIIDIKDDLGKRRTGYIHKLVAITWNINVLPEQRNIVVHLDGDTLNNRSDNLEWMDHSEALKHQFAIKQRDNRRSWKTRKKLYGKSGVKKSAI